MSEVSTKWARGAAWGAITVALLAAAALAVTVVVMSRGVDAASRTLSRGEGEALLAAIRAELGETRGPPSSADLAAVVARHRAEGLRYAAIVHRDRGVEAEAGERAMGDPRGARADEMIATNDRVRIAQPLLHGPPPRDGAGPPPPPGLAPPPILVVELEPVLVAGLQETMTQARGVGGLAVVILLGVAIALSRDVARRAAASQRAERERRLLALGQMSAVMAHELKNPLTSLKGHAQLLAEDLDAGSRAHAKAERVVQEAERLERLTSDLLDFVREGPLERQDVATADLIRRAIADMPATRVHVVIDAAPPKVSVDEPRFTLALANLVRNGAQAAPDEQVEVSVVALGPDVRIDVSDRGPGIPAGEEEAIFEPFVTTRVRGTGLGLAVARRAVEQHGGTLTGETLPEGGARFRVLLPGASRTA
jgi:two-component system sensor histidine kinase HydH